MLSQITMTADLGTMIIEKNDRSVELAYDEALKLYYQIGETFYGVHSPTKDWVFPRMRIAGEVMTPSETEGFLHELSEAIINVEINMAMVEEVEAYDFEGQGLLDDVNREKVNWLQEGF